MPDGIKNDRLRSRVVAFFRTCMPYLSWLRYLFTLVALLWMGAIAWSWRDQLGQVLAVSLNLRLAGAVGILMIANGLAALSAKWTFRLYSIELPYQVFLRVHLKRLPAKYLPGGIWQGVSRSFDLSEFGSTRGTIAMAIISEYLLAVGFAILVGVLLTFVKSEFELWGRAGMLIAIFTLLIGVVLFIIARRAGVARPALVIILVMISYTVNWIVISLAFLLFILATTNPGSIDLLIFGFYPLAWAAGFVAIFAPQGVGVSEAAFAFMASADETDVGKYIVIMAGFRVIHLISDLLSYMAANIMNSR